MEEERLKRLLPLVQLQTMDKDFGLKDEQECFSCFYDLHLSAVKCQCSPGQFSCLKHSNLMCSCEPENKTVLVRYNRDELNTLVQALEGKLDAIEQWTSKDPDNFSLNRRQHNSVKQDSERDGFETDPSMKNDSLSGLLREQTHNPKKQCSSCSDDATTSYASNHSSGKKLFGVDLSRGSPSVQQNGTFDSEIDPLSTKVSERTLLYHVDPLKLGSIASGKLWCSKQAIFPIGLLNILFILRNFYLMQHFIQIAMVSLYISMLMLFNRI